MFNLMIYFMIKQRCICDPLFNLAPNVIIKFYYKVIFLGLFLQLPAAPLPARDTDNGGNIAYERSGVSEILDSLVFTTYFKDDRFSPASPGSDRNNFPKQFVPQFSDSVYATRIAELDRRTIFRLTYNEPVKGFIRVYAVDKRKLTAKILGLTRVYFPLFEEKLRQYNIPPEMKYLAIVESALNPTAVSHAGAKGLWQFIHGTGKMYGLQSSSFIEDRFDPNKSTIAAARHLHDLYNIFGDWFLVLAAYNSGAGNVNKAIREAGGARDYWAIWPYLPEETRGYVPAFIAVNYIMNFYREHNILPVEPGYLYSDTDTVRVNNVLSFEQLTETIGVSPEELRFLNPQYKLDLIPSPSSNGNILRLPKKHIRNFRLHEREIYAYKSSKALERQQLLTMVQNMEEQESRTTAAKAGKNQKVHIVRPGESLGSIARTYRCFVSQLIEWNSLKSPDVKPGQQLVVFSVPDEAADREASSLNTVKSSTTGKSVKTAKKNVEFYKVRKGDTIGEVAEKYNVSTKDLVKWNNLGRKKTIKPGQKLRVSP
jgi:membrane-bound lytic murein transglycosylase D